MCAVKRVSLSAALLLVPLAACVVPSPVALPERPVTAPTVSAEPSAGGGVLGLRPPMCDEQRPKDRDPFPYNKDARTRDAFLQFYPDAKPKYDGGTASFDNLDASTLAALIDDRYADPADAQNQAPDIWNIFEFMCAHPEVRAAGYAVSRKRPDYRVSIEAIYAEEITPALREDAEEFCADADGLELADHLECFWD
jgi:hypothetical protein